MRIPTFLSLSVVLAVETSLAPTVAVAAGSKPAAAPPAKTSAAPVLEAEIPQSIFVLPTSAKEGRNPFFPRSSQGQLQPKPPGPIMDISAIVLNGITSPPRRTAMINGRTFEPGEAGEIKLASGAKLLIQCLDIRKDAAVILVGNQRRELRLHSGV